MCGSPPEYEGIVPLWMDSSDLAKCSSGARWNSGRIGRMEEGSLWRNRIFIRMFCKRSIGKRIRFTVGAMVKVVVVIILPSRGEGDVSGFREADTIQRKEADHPVGRRQVIIKLAG
jgi:hypothetical protein